MAVGFRVSIALLGSSFLFLELRPVETPRSWSDVNRSGLPRPAGAGCFAPRWRLSLACSPSGDEGIWWRGGVVAGPERARDSDRRFPLLRLSEREDGRGRRGVVHLDGGSVPRFGGAACRCSALVAGRGSTQRLARPAGGRLFNASVVIPLQARGWSGLVPAFRLAARFPSWGFFVVGAARRARTDVRDFGRC